MTNPSVSQRQRSQYNPLNLGTFEQTSLRLLTGSLGMRSQIIQGGYGNYTYNHWFQVTLAEPAWIILLKAGSNLSTSPVTSSNVLQNIDDRFDVSVYAQDYSPIQGRTILEEPESFFGYVAGAESDLYNTFNPKLSTKGNETFYELTPGKYLICVSATCNEAFNYSLGLVVEFPSADDNFILTEDQDTGFVLQETFDAQSEGVFVVLPSPITANTTINEISNYSLNVGQINSGIFVQVNEKNSDDVPLSWTIGPSASTNNNPLINLIELDYTENWPASVPQTHSLSEWRSAWQRDHSQDDKFPSGLFAPLTNLS